MPLITKTINQNDMMFSRVTEYTDTVYKDNKAKRANELRGLVVEHDGYLFNGDERSMDRMNRIITLANFTYNKLMSLDYTPSDAYVSAYQTQMIPWKTDDDQFIQVTVEILAAVEEKALTKMSELWIKWG